MGRTAVRLPKNFHPIRRHSVCRYRSRHDRRGKERRDPAGHYSRPDVTRLLLNTSRANRVEHFTLPVDAEVMSEIKLQA